MMMMNSIVEIDEKSKDVSSADLMDVYDMATQEPHVRACITWLIDRMNVTDMRFNGLTNESLFQCVKDDHLVAFTRDFLLFRIAFGGAPVGFKTINVDVRNHSKWCKKYFDEFGEANLKLTDFSLPLTIPYVPAFGSWKLKIKLDCETNVQSYVCESSVSSHNASAKPKRFFYVVSSAVPPPSYLDGKLRTAVASLIRDWTYLDRDYFFASCANRSRAVPTYALQHSDKITDKSEMSYRLTYGASDLGVTRETEYQTVNANADVSDDAAYRAYLDANEGLAGEFHRASSTRGIFSTPYTNPTRRALFIAPPTLVSAPTQPPRPEPPQDVGEREDRFFEKTCSAFGIPSSVVGISKRPITRDITDNDLKMCRQTMKNFVNDVESMFRRVCVELRKHNSSSECDYEWSGVTFKPAGFLDLESLTELFLNSTIPPETMSEIYEDATGMKIDFKSPPSSNSSSKITSKTTSEKDDEETKKKKTNDEKDDEETKKKKTNDEKDDEETSSKKRKTHQ